MPQIARVVIPHYPHHIVQSGRNRQVTFAEPADFGRTINGGEYLKIFHEQSSHQEKADQVLRSFD